MTTLHGIMSSRLGSEIGEDAMEISSELGQKVVMEEDIDIDLDLVDDRSEDGEDEYMIEDVELVVDQDGLDDEELRSSNDDEMADDAHTPHVAEDMTLANDEDLIDAEEDILDLNASADVITTNTDPEQVDAEDSDQYQQTPIAQNAENITNYAKDHRPSGPVSSDADIGFHRPQSPETETKYDGIHELSVPSDKSKETNEPNGNDARIDTDEVSNSKNRDDLDSKILGESENLLFGARTLSEPSQLKKTDDNHEQSLQSSTLARTPQGLEHGDANSCQLNQLGEPAKLPSHSDEVAYGDAQPNQISNVHSVIVVYQHNQISLFPPVEQNADQAETYFLSEPSLAGESIIELLKACRMVLAESINEEDELEIKIDSLNLDFCECTAESSTTSLIQILELYLQLHHNDGVDDPDPLYMTLTTKVKLANRLEYLYAAVAEGKGFADVAQIQVTGTSEDGQDGEDGNETPEASSYEDDIAIGGDKASQADGMIEDLRSAELEEEDDKFPQSMSNKLESNENLPAKSGVTIGDDRTESGQIQNKISEDEQDEAVGGENTQGDLPPYHTTYPKTSDTSGNHQDSGVGQEGNSAENSYHEAEEDKQNFGEKDESDGLPNGNATPTRISDEILLPNKYLDNTDANAANFARSTAHAEVGELGEEDSIDYEEDERIHGSSATMSTVQADDSEVPAGSDGIVLSEFHSHSIALNDGEAKPRSGSTDYEAAMSNIGVDDGNGLSRGEHERIYEFEDEKADIENEDPNISAITEQSPMSKGEQTGSFTAESKLLIKDTLAFDNDEITYDDDEEEEGQNGSDTGRTLLHTDDSRHDLAEVPGSNSPSLKRLRTDLEGGDTTRDGLQDLKRFRSY